MKDKLKIDDQVIKLLDCHTVNRLICKTDKGDLTLQIRKGETKYHLVLDSVPLEEETNIELMNILFPIKKDEIAQVDKGVWYTNNLPPNVVASIQTKEYKPRGRPKKIKK